MGRELLKDWQLATVALVIVIVVSSSGFYLVQVIEEPDNGDGPGPGSNGVDVIFNMTLEEYPRVDGSTSARPLGRLIACKVLDVPYLWDTFVGSGVYDVYANTSLEEHENTAKAINYHLVQHNGTHGSYVNLIEGEKDLILVARMPSDDELELADNHSIELEARAVALDAFVFILNTENPVDGLTETQIRNIYMGIVTNWTEVGGSEHDVRAYQRNRNSGSQELMEDLVMRGSTMIDAPDMVLPGMFGPINMVSGDEDGIGYSVYFYEEFMQKDPRVKLCGVDGVVPSYGTIQSREYVYTTEVYAVVRKGMDPGSSAVQLRDWLLTEEGQSVVKECGYVPVLEM